MKKLLTIALALFSMATFAQNQDSKNFKSSDKEIIATINTYVIGLKTGSVPTLKRVFHKDAIMYGFNQTGVIKEGSVQNLYNSITQFGPLSKVTAKSSILHRTSNTASVLADLKSTGENRNSTDYLSLMLIDGEWKIISKVYHLYDAN